MILSVVIRLTYLLLNWPLWWDSHVYVSMGKYIFSGGQSGIWEVYRPLVHPIILGGLWKLKLNPFLMGKLLDVVFSSLAIGLVYLIGKKVWNEKVGLIGAFILSFTAPFIGVVGLILADPLAMFLGLSGILVLIGQRKFFAGILLGLAFLTRFPMGIWFGASFLMILFRKEDLRKKVGGIIAVVSGFMVFVLPYLYFNYVRYEDAFIPFVAGSWIVTTATWLYGSGLAYYFRYFFVGNPIYLMFFPAIWVYFRNKEGDWKKTLLFLIPILTLLYFLYVPRKEIRYMLVALPLLALTTAYGIQFTHTWLKKKTKPVINPRAFVIICVILILLPTPTIITIERRPTFNAEIGLAVESNNISGMVFASDPSFVSFLDNKIVTLDGMEFAPVRYERFKGQYELLFVNDCDLPCNPKNALCQKTKKELIAKMITENEMILAKTYIFSQPTRECTYRMFLPK
jgi:4-amino-4-deoxy-L-arabinose transferase-like glycosyltransferase